MPLGQILWISLAAIASPVGVYYGVLAVHMWRRSRIALGPTPPEMPSKLRQLIKVSRQADSLSFARVTLFYGGIGAFIVAVLARELLGLAVAASPFALLLWMHVRTTTPPVVLILGTSTHSSIRRQRAIKRKVSPLRVVSLLDADVPWDENLKNEMALDCFRTTNQDDWWLVITQLMEVAPILAIDAAADTSGVLREGRHIFGAGLTHKCLFLTPEDGSAPILDRLLPTLGVQRRDLRFAKYEEAAGIIAVMVARIANRRS
jgi:hypothetical protein